MTSTVFTNLAVLHNTAISAFGPSIKQTTPSRAFINDENPPALFCNGPRVRLSAWRFIFAHGGGGASSARRR
jgi:hypothetical protein